MHGVGFHLDPDKEVPEDVQERAADVSLDLEQKELKDAQFFAKSEKRLSADYQNGIRSIMGNENMKHYSELRARVRKQMDDVSRKAKPNTEGEREIQEVRVKAVEGTRKFLREIGFDTARASKLRGEYHTKVRNLIDKIYDRPEKPNYLVLPEDVPEDVHNPWKIYKPPYPGSSWWYCWNKSDEPNYPDFCRYLNPATGELGTFTHTHVSGADDSDYSGVRYRTAMRFWYYLPSAGMAEIWMHLHAINTSYSGWLCDEWGWSDSHCDQESKAYLRVICPSPGALRYGTILDYRRTGTDATWNRVVTYPCNHRWMHLFSSDAYPAGTWLLLEVGNEEWNHFGSNDVSIHSAMTMRWILEEVYVRPSV